MSSLIFIGLSSTLLFNEEESSKNGFSPMLINWSTVSSPVTSPMLDITRFALVLISLAISSFLSFTA